MACLPAIEFAINLAHSDSTGYAPFFLNTGHMPRSIIWDNPGVNEYLRVCAYAQKVKYASTSVHDSIITVHVKQTWDANHYFQAALFANSDLVYVSIKNMTLSKGLAWKLIPKYIGPYLITQDYENSSFHINLPSSLKRWGIHNVFHAFLLHVHEPNDHRLFPEWLDNQIA